MPKPNPQAIRFQYRLGSSPTNTTGKNIYRKMPTLQAAYKALDLYYRSEAHIQQVMPLYEPWSAWIERSELPRWERIA